MLQTTLLLLLLFVTISSSDGALGPNQPPPKGRILFAAPVGPRSHQNFYDAIVENLAKVGYKVTLITPFEAGQKQDNVREVVLKDNDCALWVPNIFKEGSPIRSVWILPELCYSSLASDAVAEVLKEDFDLAFVSMFFGECFLNHIHTKKIPYVFVNPVESFGPMSGYRMGSPMFPSFDKNFMVKFKHPMSLLERSVVVVMEFAMWVFFGYLNRSFDSMGRELKLFSPGTPSISEISANASLMVMNSHRLTEHPRSYMPNILLLGGIHCRPPQPLPKDLAEWVSSSGEVGFIFFSLGSAMRSTDIPDDKVKVLVSAFASLPQKVLWKYEGSGIPRLPDNVRLIKWAPQQDLLGDPHMRLLITHGGLMSVQEAMYHGVPVLGLPVFGEQVGSMFWVEQQGWGRMLSWEELTHDKFKDTIELLIGNKTIIQRVQELGRLMRDEPVAPADALVWWTGYLLRTGGAPHLRSGAVDLNWYQLYNLDVWLVLGSIVLLLLWLVLKMFWWLGRTVHNALCPLFCRDEQTKQVKKQKKH